MLSGLLSLASCSEAVPSADTPDPTPDELAANQVNASSLESDVRLLDAPSSPAIVLRWKGGNDGSQAVSSLDFEVENTSDAPIDVDVNVVTQAGKRNGQVAGKRVRLGGKAKVDQSVSVSQLGVQLVDSSANTVIIGRYKGADGVQRAVPLSSVWVEHEAGFATARVRSEAVEAKANLARAPSAVGGRRPSDARAIDPMSGAATRINPSSDDLVGAGRVIAQPPQIPDPVKFLAGRKASTSLETDGLPDAQRSPSTVVSSELSDKGGNYTVCFQLPYYYVDSLFGEDHLVGQTWATVGFEPARYMLAALINPAGQLIYLNYLSPGGCTSVPVNHPNGTYTGMVTTALYRESTDVGIDITSDDTKTFTWGSQTYNISGAGGTVTLSSVYGFGTQSDAAISAANSIYRSTFAYANGMRTNIYVDQTCPSVPGSGCASGNNIWLGNNASGFPYAYYKNVTTHELGHRVMGGLFGVLANPYAIDATQAACRCDHVTSSNNLHCLQSRHQLAAAQVEGWGQFFASTNVNDGSQANCTFVYYKEFREDTGTVVAPPLAKSCFSQTRWLNNHCNSSARGTEFDWMNFYWRLANKDTYSFANFKSVYNQACGGSCSGASPTWATLTTAASTAFGVGSARALAWSGQGSNFGVNH